MSAHWKTRFIPVSREIGTRVALAGWEQKEIAIVSFLRTVKSSVY
jgi:hypothetical protein